jgi:hypothetical protein
MEMLREGLGPDRDFAVDFHARPSPTVAAIILREIEPLNLLFAEEICPPENARAMARAFRHSTTPIATGEPPDRFICVRGADRYGRGRCSAARYRARGPRHTIGHLYNRDRGPVRGGDIQLIGGVIHTAASSGYCLPRRESKPRGALARSSLRKGPTNQDQPAVGADSAAASSGRSSWRGMKCCPVDDVQTLLVPCHGDDLRRRSSIKLRPDHLRRLA